MPGLTFALLAAALVAAPADPAPSTGAAAPQPAASARPSRLVARFRAHHVKAIDAEPCEGGWRFYDGTVGRPYQLLGTVTRRSDGEAWQVHDHVGRLLGTIEPDREGWAIYDHVHDRIGSATKKEVQCPNGRRPPLHPRKGFPEIAMHAFFGPDAE